LPSLVGPVTVPLGYLDYLTWQSRRIHLYPEGNPPVVRRCQIQQNLKSTEVLDPFKCFVRSKEGGFRPLSLRPEKALGVIAMPFFNRLTFH
jgi:hypothetical protein